MSSALEKVCEYRFDVPDGPRETVSVWFDGKDVYRRYQNNPQWDYALSGASIKQQLSAKAYNKLFKYNQVLLDFLNAKLGV